jgi:SNW domain-containing protein 1
VCARAPAQCARPPAEARPAPAARQGFQGADYSGRDARGGAAGPVQFERDPAEADPFGLDQFLTEVNKGGKRAGPLDGIGGGGAMRAGGGGGSYEDYAGAPTRSRVEFSKGRG